MKFKIFFKNFKFSSNLIWIKLYFSTIGKTQYLIILAGNMEFVLRIRFNNNFKFSSSKIGINPEILNC